ncbi:MAG: bifunctional 3,4-dihydroxy-2-butanone-4-phosphate synthase/GTP cyclohydrolase II [Chloroflexi bacterium]|nr:bifunctional 3,4-dihydroxy-2-butanone-4-phosphate synthase/GTP cyclohydrolase II [Chloroflexota bacterium]MCZ6789296.1 bifunctional 3,4-dihydroxy-2-butanone-4-phosphate synthase/GTP cyclohydrolase II [Chloroflexota bacterium]
MPLASVEEAIEEIRQGKFVIIVDDEDRENEGDLAIAAEAVTPESISYMATYGRGLICMPMMGKRLDALNLPPMVAENTARLETAFTVSVDYKRKTSTGISAHDRAATVLALIDPDTRPEDIARPGHLFPLRYAEGGVLVRAGQTEAIVDLTTMAGLYPAGVICEVMDDDGTMQRMPQLEKFSSKHGVKLISVAQIIDYRQQHESLVERVAETRLPTHYGEFTAIAFKSVLDPDEHLALVKGDIQTPEPVLVRMHSQCLTGDTFGSLRCDCGEQIARSLQLIAQEGRGIFVYMRQEGRGIGLHNKIRAYALQDNGMDTVEANEHLGFPPDLRWYGIGAQILVNLGVRDIRLLTNNPKKVVGLESYGLHLVERVPIVVSPNEENRQYLDTKREKLGHLLELPTDGTESDAPRMQGP